MEKFTDFRQLLMPLDFFFQKIFHGLHIMIGGSFDLLDVPGIIYTEVFSNCIKKFVGRLA